MMVFKTIAAAAPFFVLSLGGAPAKETPTPTAPPYTKAGLEKYAQPGTCQIIGRALVNTKTFGPLVFSGQKVHLAPLNDYAVWYVKRLAELSPNSTLRYPNDLVPFNREAITDSNGNFSFDHIYCGSYLVEMFTDYEHDSNSVENRTVYSTNDDDFPVARPMSLPLGARLNETANK